MARVQAASGGNGPPAASAEPPKAAADAEAGQAGQAAAAFPDLALATGLTARHLPLLAFLAWECLLVMVLLFQVRAVKHFNNGADSYFVLILVSGGVGIAAALFPLIFVCESECRSAFWFTYGQSCGLPNRRAKAITGCLHIAFIAAYAVLLSFSGEKAALVTEVTQVLWFEPSCENSSLLVVEETLTLGVPRATITYAERVLPNQVEPILMGMENPDNVPGLTLVGVDRIKKGKWQLDYETGQVTKVRVTFARRKEPLRVLLRYRARVGGASGSCGTGAVCASLTPGLVRVAGEWDVFLPGKDVRRSAVVGGCWQKPCPANWTYASSLAMPSVQGKLRFEVQLPASLDVGGESCPLAWELPDRNLFWSFGALLLAIAVGICYCGLWGGEGSAMLLAAGIAAVFGLAAAVSFALALSV